jgi:hypothetical protein
MLPITGRLILENFPLRNLFIPDFGAEIIYSFVIIVCSLMIYFGTKEVYELSSYKGIKYFRYAFLFFAIAYFFRSFIKFALVYFNIGMILEIPPREFGFLIGQFTLFVFIYFSSMAIFYLLSSARKNNSNIYFYNILAVILSTITILFRNPLVYLGLNLFLFVVVLFTVHISRETKNKLAQHSKSSIESKKKNKLHIIYFLLSFFWILNIIDILIPKFFEVFQIFIYLASLTIFLIMVYKVLKKVGPD